MSGLFVDNDGKMNWKKFGYHARSAAAVVLSLAVLIGGGVFLYDKAHDAYTSWRSTDDYIGEGTDPVTVTIPVGANLTQIGDVLLDSDVVKSMKAFQKAARQEPDATQIQAGRYRLKKQLPAAVAIQMLLDTSNIDRITVTIPEGLRLSEQFTLIDKATAGKISIKDLQAVAAQPEELQLPAYANKEPEGFLFPNTYEIGETPTASDLLLKMTAQFDVVADELDLVNAAKTLDRTPREVVTIASIIEAEAPAKYQPQVSRVIYNRLAKGQKLEMDSTVHYAVGKDGRVTTTDAERASGSPYNTYRVEGLPPGPINSPGKTALSAALKPADGPWLFFVTVNLDTGETLFSETFDQHEKNVAQLQKWCSDNKGRC